MCKIYESNWRGLSQQYVAEKGAMREGTLIHSDSSTSLHLHLHLYCTWAVILVVSSSAEDDSKPDCSFCPLAVPCCFCPAAPARAGRPSHPVVSQLLPETAREKWTRKNMKQTCLKVRARKITKVLRSLAHKENLRYMSKVGDCELFICCDIFSKDDNLFLKALCRVSRV